MDELKRKFEEYRKDYEKRKEHIREEASRKSKALAEDNKHFQRYSERAENHSSRILSSSSLVR